MEMNMKNKDENEKKLDWNMLAIKSALNLVFKGIDIKYVEALIDKIEELDNKVVDFLTRAKSNQEVQIVESYLNQGLQLIDDLEKKGEENESK